VKKGKGGRNGKEGGREGMWRTENKREEMGGK